MLISKRHLVYIFVTVTVGFLLIQFRVHQHVIKVINAKVAIKLPASVDFTAHHAVQLFMDVCLAKGLPVFVIDPFVLKLLGQGNSSHDVVCLNENCSETCRYLCTYQEITTFGVLGRLWKQQDHVNKAFQRRGFTVSVFTLNGSENMAKNDSNTGSFVPLHVLLVHTNGHAIHVVIFHQRGEITYWWHGHLAPSSDKLFIAITNSTFVTREGSYRRIDLVKVKLDGIKLRIPKYPERILWEMKSSHFIACNESRATLFYSKFPRETNVESEMFFTAARNVLRKAKQVLDSVDIPFWISSGTCLGWLRQCDLIPYSKDVDIGIWIKDYTDDIIQKLEESGLMLIHKFGKVEDSLELSFIADSVKLDIFFFYDGEDNSIVWNGGTQAKTGKKFKYTFSRFSLCWTEFLQLHLRVPCDTKTYVEANYGKNWFEPVKHWDWKSSPSNVEQNGEWPLEERHIVIKQFR